MRKAKEMSIGIKVVPRSRAIKLPYAVAATFLEGEDITHRILINASRSAADELIFDALRDPMCLSAYLWDQKHSRLLWSWQYEGGVYSG